MPPENNSHNSDPKVVRLIRPSVVILCGPAACGKSTFAAKHFRTTQIVSSDHARAMVCDDERDQRYQTQAFALLHFLLEQRLGINRLCVVDSTALTAPARKSLLEIARRFQVPVVVLLFDAPLETCLERDAQRERTVGRAIIERQYEQFREARATLQQEGFDQVIELRDAELDQVRFETIFRPVPHLAQNNVRPEARRFAARPSRPPTAPAPEPHDARKPTVPNGRPPDASA